MTEISDIKWGSYRAYEGPYYLGSHKFQLPAAPSAEACAVAVVTSTEGGTYDAYNGYDVCISSSGLIQMCEKSMFGVSSLLGAVVEANGRHSLGSLFIKQLSDTGYAFNKTSKGKYRFFKDGAVVDTLEEQQRLFLCNSNGKKGSWDRDSILWAKKWAVAISSVWDDPKNQTAQMNWIARRLPRFCMPYATSILGALPDTDICRALTSAYYSFTSNNPTWAVEALKAAIASGANPETLDGATKVLKFLTFYKGITIYPHRYDKISKVLREVYGVEFPRTHQMLSDSFTVLSDTLSRAWDTKQYQEALYRLGFDLGPRGMDGVWGEKTTSALFSFEEAWPGMPSSRVDGKPDEYAQEALEQAVLSV